MIFLISCRQLFQMLSLEAGDLRLWWEENNQLVFSYFNVDSQHFVSDGFRFWYFCHCLAGVKSSVYDSLEIKATVLIMD